MEKKSKAQQKLEARKQVKESFEKIEPYIMPNVSKKERAEVVAKSVNTRDCFGRKLPKEGKSEYLIYHYRQLQREEEDLIQRIERGLDTYQEQCEGLEGCCDIVAIEDLEGELLLILDKEMESKINAIKTAMKELEALDEKLQAQIKKNGEDFLSGLGL